MAKVLMPLLSTEARGRMGGLVYNTWHGINYVKAHTSPNQPGSAAQLAARSRVQQLSQAWKDLSDAERDSWNAYALEHLKPDFTGTPRRVTGFNWYVACSVQLLRLSKALVDTAPEVDAPDPPDGVVLADGTNKLTLDWTAEAGTDLSIELFLYGPHSAGRVGKIEQATSCNIWTAETVGPVDAKDPAAAGTYSGWARIISETTGLTSTWVKYSVAVA